MSLRGNKPRHVKQVEQPEWDRSYHEPPQEQKPVGHLTSVKQFHDLEVCSKNALDIVIYVLKDECL